MRSGLIIAGLSFGIALMSAAPSWGQEAPAYDGTGSQWVPLPGDEQKPRGPGIGLVKKLEKFKQPYHIFNLGTVYHQGLDGETVDHDRAYGYYEEAATKGDDRAIALLCVSYLIGDNRPSDYNTAMSHCLKLKETDPERIFAQAYDYELGVSGPADVEVAMMLYYDAAKAGSADAMNRLGLMFKSMPGKLDVARSSFREGAIRGSAAAMYHLAQMAEKGDGGEQDTALAGWLYTHAARRGHKEAKAWLAAQPSPPILRRARLFGKGKTAITEVVIKDGVKTRQPLSLDKITDGLYPKVAANAEIEGIARLDCYISRDHRVDVCLQTWNLPVGIPFSHNVLKTLRNEVMAETTDLDGRPTAQTVQVLTVNFMF